MQHARFVMQCVAMRMVHNIGRDGSTGVYSGNNAPDPYRRGSDSRSLPAVIHGHAEQRDRAPQHRPLGHLDIAGGRVSSQAIMIAHEITIRVLVVLL